MSMLSGEILGIKKRYWIWLVVLAAAAYLIWGYASGHCKLCKALGVSLAGSSTGGVVIAAAG